MRIRRHPRVEDAATRRARLAAERASLELAQVRAQRKEVQSLSKGIKEHMERNGLGAALRAAIGDSQ